MLILPGASALSEFRQQRLLKKLQQVVPQVTGLSAEYMHFVQLDQALDANNETVLKRLLEDGPSETG